MNKKVAKLWTEALRSKKYKKTTGALKVVKDGKARFSALDYLRKNSHTLTSTHHFLKERLITGYIHDAQRTSQGPVQDRGLP